MTSPKHPMQPIVTVNGVLRFKQNAIIRKLLDKATEYGYGMNEIMYDFCDSPDHEDLIQLYQLIGYSLSGFGGLTYVDNLTYETAALMASGKTETEARIEYLEALLKQIKDSIRPVAAELFSKHPDDLL